MKTLKNIISKGDRKTRWGWWLKRVDKNNEVLKNIRQRSPLRTQVEDNAGNGVTVGRRAARGGKDDIVVVCRDVGYCRIRGG